jgi:general secretion pathway protein C
MGQFNLESFRKPVSLGVLFMLGAWTIYLVVENVFFYLDADLAATVSEPSESVQSPASTVAGTGPSQATRQLFGRVDDNQPEQVVSAPTTRLNLELQGVFLSDVPSTSSAIVAERGKDGKLYLVGDKLPGNSVLHSVESDHILLRRGARLEKLLFITKRLNIKASSTASTRAKDGSRKTASNTRQPAQAPQAGSSSAGSTILSQVRDRLQRNPQAVLKEYGLSAVAPGSSQGYKVDTAHPALNNTGLQPGDRVVSVNGAPLGVAMNDARLIDQARAAGRVRVEVERGGRRFFLTIPIP